MMNKHSERTTRLALSAIFCALAFLTALLPTPKVSGFLSFDVKDTVIALAALLLGPSVSVALSFAVPILEMITVGSTGIWGLLMDIISSLAFSFTASIIYKYRKSLVGALVSLVAATAMQVAVMMLANIVITPLYTGAPRSAVIAMLIPILLPFNAVKSFFNASLVMLLYKPISEALRRAHLLPSSHRRGGSVSFSSPYRFGLKSILVLSISFLAVVGMLLVLFLVLDASYGG